MSNFFSSIHQWFVDHVWKPSWTMFTTWAYGIPAMLVTAGQAISKLANDSTIAGYLDKMGMPNWVPVSLAAVALVYYIAHGRED